MDLNHYQQGARATARYPEVGSNPIYPTLGLCGEAGEVADKVKKVIRDDDGVFSDPPNWPVNWALTSTRLPAPIWRSSPAGPPVT